MRTCVYVDGFNLYFGALKGTPFRWLDLRRLFALLLPSHGIDRIKYFTAHVTARANDPDQPLRQQMYLRAQGSDVNLAAHLVHDAHQRRFDTAVLVTNDSDLLEAVKIVKSLGLHDS